jgi:hypothetical protein
MQDSFNAFYNNDADKALSVLIQRADLVKEALQGICPQATAVMHEAASIVGFAADIAEAAYSKAARQ